MILHGPPAVGKLTVARELSKITGLPVFHNHLVVDAVAALFPFGEPQFVNLRERWWIDAFGAALKEDRSLIFTFQPEPSVAPEFIERVTALIESGEGSVDLVSLTASPSAIDERITAHSLIEFGKMRSVELLRELRPAFEACEAAMPQSAVEIDTEKKQPAEAAREIAAALGLAGGQV